MKESTAIEFLFFSYFGVSINSEPEDLLNVIIDKAYRDATQQGAYNVKIGKDNLKEDSDKHIEKAREIIREYIKRIDNEKNYETWHNEFMTRLYEEYADITTKDKNKIFTYGNAQKWINMTVKYIVLVHALISNTDNIKKDFCEIYGNKFIECENELHIPVDSYIIEALWHEELEEDEKGFLNNKKDINAKNFKVRIPLKDKVDISIRKNKYSSDYAKPWSSWEKESDYDNFQSDVKDFIKKKNKTPLDWENEAWVKIAMRRKNK